MSIQQPPTEWDDTIDLRKWIDALFHYKWLILTCALVAAVAATIFGYVIQTPTFEATGGATLPSADGTNGLGLTLRGYQEFATSTPVMDSVGQKLGRQTNAGQLRARYTIQLEKDERFINISASAETAEEAFLLASRWIEAYDEQLQAQIQSKFASLKENASRKKELLGPALELAKGALNKFDLEYPITAMEARLPSLEDELTNSETRLSELTLTLIPAQETRLASRERVLYGEAGTIGGGGSSFVASPTIDSADEVEPANATKTNPAYLALSQRLLTARLAPLEKELVTSEGLLRELTWSAIPISEAKLASLQDALKAEPKTLRISPTPEQLPRVSPRKEHLTDNNTVPNPIYLQLIEEIQAARGSLEGIQKEAEILVERIPLLESEVIQLREDLVATQEYSAKLTEKLEVSKELEQLIGNLAASRKEAVSLTTSVSSSREAAQELRKDLAEAKLSRENLDREVTKFREAYEPALAESVRLQEIESRLDAIGGLSTIREPAVPTTPVATQRTRNILLAGVLGVMLGVIVAIFLQYYGTTPPAARASEQRYNEPQDLGVRAA